MTSGELSSWRLLSHERELVPITSLKLNSAVNDVEEATATQAQWIAPFENRPLSILKQVLDDTNHLRPSKLPGKHVANRIDSHDRFTNYLVIRRIGVVQGRECIGVSAAKRVDPRLNDLPGTHGVVFHITGR